MSIRLWLMVADCWRCGASIELTEEQEHEALRLLREREASREAETRAAGPVITPTTAPAPKSPPPPDPGLEPQKTPEPAPQAAPTPPPLPPQVPLRAPPRRVAAAEVPRGTRARIRELYERGAPHVLWRDVLRDLPAWLVSLVLHLVVMLLLGLWMISKPQEAPSITLATAISYEDIEGDVDEPTPLDAEAFEFDDPGAIPPDEVTPIESPGRSEVFLESEAVQSPDPIGELSELSDLAMMLPMAPAGSMFAGRDPMLRRQLVRQQGGTSETEAAVARGLVWLARHQFADGHWSLHAWHQAPGAAGRGDGLGGMSDTAGTALALLPFLGAGQTHLRGEYSDVVDKGLRWLIYHQQENGNLMGEGIGRMYAHGQAAIALCEAYGMTRDPQLRDPAQRALDFIVDAQHPAGGWRYEPGQAGDTSVVGWQLMALRSGKMAYLHVPQRVFDLADRYLDSVADRYGGQYAYQPHRRPSHVMSAEALLCRQYLGWPRDHRGLRLGTRQLLNKHPPMANSPNMYYWYYATQVMHHMGGDLWYEWNARMRPVLLQSQRKDGPMAGSWDPRGGHSSRGGRVYMTALAVCTLEVYYRHLPMYRSDVVKEFQPSSAETPGWHR